MIAHCVLIICFLGSRASAFSTSLLSQRKEIIVKHARQPVSLRAIDISSLNVAPPGDSMLTTVVGSTGVWADASNALIVVGGLAYFAYEKRPRGSARSELVEMRPSTVRNANFGAFSTKFIPKGTLVGQYPGYLRSLTDAIASKESQDAGLAAQSYFFAVDDDQVLDPTNKQGVLEDTIRYLGLFSADTLMARINEPPLGGDVNLCTAVTASGVSITAERDIFADEELFMDYGSDYNRYNYISDPTDSNEEENPTQLRKRLKQEPDVFETIIPKEVDAKSNSVTPPSVVAEPAVPSSRITTSSSSMFDQLIGNSLAANTGVEDIGVEKPTDSKSRGILMGGDEGVVDKKGDITDAPMYRPALSVRESEELLKGLDSMTDGEVAAILAKLKAAVGERIKSEVSDALFSKKTGTSSSTPKIPKEVESKKMPRAPPVDPEMRQKYKRELDAIENELDKIYSDPMGVWQEFMANPEKFLNEGEIKLADDEDLQ